MNKKKVERTPSGAKWKGYDDYNDNHTWETITGMSERTANKIADQLIVEELLSININ